ncbi:putative basic proline-rich protein-like [Iris pallida]|uniref:Basic proline-rich protein-like n=1 Tax=Iris pallida TaxID=29817 RepID=A0AAX6GER8_IRIPA|nr:putative basic proline-rich protein-like [Iris pallida]KAJ6845244.1 putative basic proline-rich protein-like [Iris pallida]
MAPVAGERWAVDRRAGRRHWRKERGALTDGARGGGFAAGGGGERRWRLSPVRRSWGYLRKGAAVLDVELGGRGCYTKDGRRSEKWAKSEEHGGYSGGDDTEEAGPRQRWAAGSRTPERSLGCWRAATWSEEEEAERSRSARTRRRPARRRRWETPRWTPTMAWRHWRLATGEVDLRWR